MGRPLRHPGARSPDLRLTVGGAGRARACPPPGPSVPFPDCHPRHHDPSHRRRIGRCPGPPGRRAGRCHARLLHAALPHAAQHHRAGRARHAGRHWPAHPAHRDRSAHRHEDLRLGGAGRVAGAGRLDQGAGREEDRRHRRAQPASGQLQRPVPGHAVAGRAAPAPLLAARPAGLDPLPHAVLQAGLGLLPDRPPAAVAPAGQLRSVRGH